MGNERREHEVQSSVLSELFRNSVPTGWGWRAVNRLVRRDLFSSSPCPDPAPPLRKLREQRAAEASTSHLARRSGAAETLPEREAGFLEPSLNVFHRKYRLITRAFEVTQIRVQAVAPSLAT